MNVFFADFLMLQEPRLKKYTTMLSLLLDMAQTGEQGDNTLAIGICRNVIMHTFSSVMVGNIGLARIPGVHHGEMKDTSRFYEGWVTVEWGHSGRNQSVKFKVQIILDMNKKKRMRKNEVIQCITKLTL